MNDLVLNKISYGVLKSNYKYLKKINTDNHNLAVVKRLVYDLLSQYSISRRMFFARGQGDLKQVAINLINFKPVKIQVGFGCLIRTCRLCRVCAFLYNKIVFIYPNKDYGGDPDDYPRNKYGAKEDRLIIIKIPSFNYNGRVHEHFFDDVRQDGDYDSFKPIKGIELEEAIANE